ncbi:MAG TPA: UDP-4-amino-4,6-dideoxy-N-acetyl-beta-L-altrosamine transaminase [Candidatus Kerfeldbacteria bacterium]|nr:MAG: Glutamine-scyllo-inositol transaminase [Parcubacteria group bacterium GW2011_GWA2_48_9]KKW16718.1 MAG: Glutamine-scyllo-inositol transaminase [Parcubacteria group bacterium GW2011_GWC2_49_9]HCJ52300.1 UDP-4-amino-4,6-dideoxy-N-acetyl-beta-L-altrosamine transaminase [Candidatus Kerfeldbacteria bacterium]HCM68025.1 UDP-4-amino-4,6-dideoxy-N-acetyl-beta-L-altrosamine transaminase [Candidatus Kerfeldbacteria bacterium]
MKQVPLLPHFIPFGAPKFSRHTETEVIRTLRSGWIGTGPKVLEFERLFAHYVHAPFAVALSSCTAGLHLSLVVSGVGRGDEVITSPLTFAATANAILTSGATVKFADVDLATYTLSPRAAQRAITKKTRAIIPVHFAGLPADMKSFEALARRYRLHLIEDAAHALGARSHGAMIGATGNLTSFSFYPNKNITSCDGGMLTFADRRFERTLKTLRHQGLDVDAWKRFHRKSLQTSLALMHGYKYTMNDLQAIIGIEQLKHAEAWQKTRERYAAYYDSIFTAIPGVFFQYRPLDKDENRHALYLYTLRLERKFFGHARDQVVQTLLRKNIGAGVHYIPLHLHPAFRHQKYRRGDFPIAEKIGDEIFTIPLTPHLSFSVIRAIARVTKAVLLSFLRRRTTP